MAELTVRLVAVDREVWSGTATSVVAKTVEGDLGVLPGHEPVLSLLVDGVVRITPVEGPVQVAAVHGGFLSVENNTVSLLAEAAELAAEVDVARAEAALEAAAAGTSDAVRAEIRLKAAAHPQAHAN